MILDCQINQPIGDLNPCCPYAFPDLDVMALCCILQIYMVPVKRNVFHHGKKTLLHLSSSA